MRISQIFIFILTFIVSTLLFINIAWSQSNTADQHKSDLIGAWHISSIHWVTKDTTYSIAKAQPGQFMVTPTSYSIMWIPTEEPRVPFQILSNPTDDELKAGFRSVVFNGGSHILTDSTLTTTAMIAKVPGFEGGKQFYKYEVNGDHLEITMFDETYPDGTKPEWFGRYETKFVMSRVK